MSATVGGLIKDYRIQKNIRQLEIAFSLGWKETSRLSRIEQGKKGKPSRALLDKIMQAMKLDEDQKNQLLLTGCYIPTDQEIADMRDKVSIMLEKWHYPAACIDFTGRTLKYNHALTELYGLTEKQKKDIESELKRSLEISFDPEFPLNNFKSAEQQDARRRRLLRMLIHFQHDHRNHTREPWYQELIKKMMDNNNFRELWTAAQQSSIKELDLSNFNPNYDYPHPGKNTLLNFYYLLFPLFQDPRYLIELYIPGNRETHDFFA